MARTYKRDSRGRFSGSGGGGGGGKSRPAPRQVQRGVNRLTRDNAGRITSVGGSGATARGGRIRTAAGNLRATVTSKAGMVSQGRLTGAPLKSTIGKTSKARLNMGLTRPGKPGQREAYNAARTQLRANKPAVKPATRKEQLIAGSKKRTAQADRIDAKVKKLENEYRSKDAAFYTQGVKPAGRDRMIAKSQQAAQLREESAALRSKAANAERMASRNKGDAAQRKQERRNAFDTAGYKVGDTVTTRQYGTQKITKISKNSVSFEKGNTQDKAFMANYLGLQGKPSSAATKPVSSKGARLGGSRSTIRAAAPANTVANRTGQSKTLNKFNSRPVGTRILNAKNQLVPSPTRVPLRVAGAGSKESDRAFARVATKAARVRAKSAAAKPARKAIGKISEAKAGRIISRIDANRPGLRKASGSARKTANAIRTQRRATDFALAAGARARKKGQNLSVNQSLQRAIANATKKPKRMR